MPSKKLRPSKFNSKIEEEDELVSKGIKNKGLRVDLYNRVKENSHEGGVKEWIDEVKKKLFHFKDYANLREKMSEFYQKKLGIKNFINNQKS